MEKREAPKFISWDVEGEFVVGELLKIDSFEKEGKHVPRFTVLEEESGKMFSFLGTRDINQKLLMRDIGKRVEIRYVGLDHDVVRNGNAMKLFDVRVSKAALRAHVTPEAGLRITDADIPF